MTIEHDFMMRNSFAYRESQQGLENGGGCTYQERYDKLCSDMRKFIMETGLITPPEIMQLVGVKTH